MEDSDAAEESAIAKHIRLRFEQAIEDLYSSDARDHAKAVAGLEALARPLLAPEGSSPAISALDKDSRHYLADAAFWLAVLTASGLLEHAVAADGPRSQALLQAAADVHNVHAHLALAYRYETGFLTNVSCDTAYSHLKVCDVHPACR